MLTREEIRGFVQNYLSLMQEKLCRLLNGRDLSMERERVDVSNVIKFAGTFIAFLIGSGFATGQEILQYFTSYGLNGLLTGLLMLVLFVYVGADFIRVGFKQDFKKGSDIFAYYCGKHIGMAYDYFTIAFLFMSYVVMIAGAGATLNQHFGVPYTAGAIAMMLLAGGTVIMGLGRIVDVIGRMGPVIVVLAIGLGLISVFKNPAGIVEGSALINSGSIEVIRAGTNWFTSACSYVGFCMLWLAAFLAALGKRANSAKEAVLGTTFGAIGFAAGCIIMMLGLLANIKTVAGSQIPSLLLAGEISHIFATVFSAIIFVGIYTTAVPLLWQCSARFAEEKSKNFYILTIVLAAAGCFIGLALPFNKLVNIIYGINGYVGILLLAFIVVKDVRTRFAK